MRSKAQRFYRQELIVEGSGAFPFDMLRYDTCIPNFESEMHLLTMTFRDDPEAYRKPRRIRLLRFTSADCPPTDARWRSFLWKVVEWRTL